ncbi:HWE histidine kinase domain-containing protein [Sphingomonas sp. PB1R3]|uniref:HWE histidine kinase domain-containing protein n=1 Tax=Sphingomonas flavida TaxID=3096154 RepID=UPI002FCA745B
MPTDVPPDLTACDREPIHRLGTIQPFGFLIATTLDWLIVSASDNVEEQFGKPAAKLLGSTLNDVFDREAVHRLRNRLGQVQDTNCTERIFGLDLFGDGRLFDCAVHYSGDLAIIEAEPNQQSTTAEVAGLIRSMTSRLDAESDLDAFIQQGARQMHLLIGFDRVMVYRFDKDGSGEVVAEAVRHGVAPLHGLHFPASDIPQQARALYLRNPFRFIVDVNQAPVPILSLDPNGSDALDLSSSILRAVSPIHIRYLQNMGVTASLSVSIIVEGRLWGLFACHHFRPRNLPFDIRTVVELFGEMFSLRLENRERKIIAAKQALARSTGVRLLTSFADDASLLTDADRLMTILNDIIPCDGVAVKVGDRIAASGVAPAVEDVPAITRRLHALTRDAMFVTDHLIAHLPEACTSDSNAAGLIAIPITTEPGDYVMLFRRERIRSVTWAGNPGEAMKSDASASSLSPRSSFAAWREEVRHRSNPFTANEQKSAETLRVAIIEIVLKLAGAAGTERQRALQQQEMLIAELNHRVRNILTLISALMWQSRHGTDNDAGTAVLESRILALARAHDQITRYNWAPADLRTMVEGHADQYSGACRFQIEGKPALLAPTAYATLALVLHELFTNSCKYGAISASGRVEIDWCLDRDGGLTINWSEHGGPASAIDRRQGLGTTIIERLIPHDLGGTASLSFEISGVRARFGIPPKFVGTQVSEQPGAILAALPHADEPPVALKIDGSVLLVEDNFLIANHADGLLTRAGINNVVIAASVADAFEKMRACSPSVAILDFSLRDANSLPVADRLLENGIPFLFATGYGEQLRLPERLAHVPVLQKPYGDAALISALHAVTRKD